MTTLKPARDLAAPPIWLHWLVSCRYPVEPPTASLRSPPGASRVARHTEDDACGSWLTYLLTDLGELPCSSPVVYVDNKVMIALCQEHRLEHRTKHIALRYFIARELQQRGQLRLAYVATRANTADIFTKALQSGDHQHFSTVLGLWLTRDTAARLAICNHLPLAERDHFGQHKTTKALYDAVVAHYSSPATVALGRLLLPYLFPELSAFATVEDLVTHLCTSDARYRSALLAEFLDKNLPPMYIILYFIVTRLPDSLRAVRDHFLALDPTDLTVDLLEKHLLEAETSVVVVGAARGTPRTPFFEGCSPSPLAPSYASAAAADILGAEDVGTASALSGKQRSCKGKGGKSGGGGSGGGGGGGSGGSGGGRGGGSGGSGGGSGGFGRCSGGGGGGGSRGSDGSGGSRGGAVQRGGLEAAALGASGSALPGTAPAEAVHTFTLDSCATRCFFCDSTTLTPLSAPVPVRLVDPSGGPVLARSSTVLPCPAVPSGSLLGLHLPSFSTNLVSLPPLPPSPAPPCLPYVEGRQRAAPHSSSFPSTTSPLQTLHMDVWGPDRVNGQDRERYFLLVVDDYTRYTTVFPLHSKGEVPDVLTPWICAVRLQLRKRFREDLPVLRQHSDRGGEFSFDLLRDFCRAEGILQSFTLPASPQRNGIAEHRIGLLMEVAHTSMIHAAAPHFLWPFAVRYAVHQLNLWPRVSLPETSPTLRWTGEVGDASVFRFYHPTLQRVLPSEDVMFDESVPFYRLFPHRSAPLPPPPLFLAPGPPPVDPLSPQGPTPSGAARGTTSGGAEPASVEPGGAEPAGAEPGGAEPEGAESGGAELGGAEPGGYCVY
ncbi:unnamed protein product [Closterium sp. NIES-53]